MNKCECGGIISNYDLSDNEIEDCFLILKFECSCLECGKEYLITEKFKVDFEKPFDTLIEAI